MFWFKCLLISDEKQSEDLQVAKSKEETKQWSKEGIKIAMVNHTINFTRRDGVL